MNDHLYYLPSLDLLDDSELQTFVEEDLLREAETIQNLMNELETPIQVVNIYPNTQGVCYGVHPGKGVRIKNVVKRALDIQIALNVYDVHIDAIPGTSELGIYIIKDKTDRYSLKNCVSSVWLPENEGKTTYCLGMDNTGECICANLEDSTHLLIGGATGTGKTTLLQSIIMSFLFGTGPRDLRFLIVDTEESGLARFNDLPQMLIPVVTDPSKAVGAIAWAVAEAKDRLDRFTEMTQVKELEEFNTRVEMINAAMDNEGLEGPRPVHLSRIVIIIDDISEIIRRNPDVMQLLIQVIDMGRKTGIHLILSTRRANAIIPSIRANIGTRLCFHVASKPDSEAILDSAGAEQIRDVGEFLYRSNTNGSLVKGYSITSTDTEIDRVVSFLARQKEAASAK